MYRVLLINSWWKYRFKNNESQQAQTSYVIPTILFSVISVSMILGCSSSYQGERLKVSTTMLQEIDNMSVNEAIETVNLYFQNEAKKYTSLITSKEWEQMKNEMNSEPWIDRQLSQANLDAQSRRQWHEWLANSSAIEHRLHLEDYSHWVVDKELSEVNENLRFLQRQPIPPETKVTEYHYTDVIELRKITNNNSKTGLILYCDTKSGSGYSFWTYPENEEDLERLMRAFIKLCPNIKVKNEVTETD